VKIALGSDHAGFLLKDKIKEFLQSKELKFTDYGTFKIESVHYPEYAYRVSQSVASKENDIGILICGTGIGMSITANKIKGIRAALIYNTETARLSRLHNDANVLCLGGRLTSEEEAFNIVDTFLSTSFEGGRHSGRVELIHRLTGV